MRDGKNLATTCVIGERTRGEQGVEFKGAGRGGVRGEVNEEDIMGRAGEGRPS